MNYISKEDIVQVVRCKDCCFCTEFVLNNGKSILYCEVHAGLLIPTDYCSYGRRKEDEVL